MAGQRTLDPLMVVRIHQGQLGIGAQPVTAYRSPRSLVSPHSWIVGVEKRGLAVWKQKP